MGYQDCAGCRRTSTACPIRLIGKESAAISAGLRYGRRILDDHDGCGSWQARELRARLGIWAKEQGIE